jgi:hypothetical protein
MKTRLGYMGGNNQIDRMNKDKLHSLKKALLYSYQAATAILSDGREFRCLINPNKLSLDLDNKILSIPFVDYVLNPGSGLHPDIGHNTNHSEEGKWEDMEDLVAVLTYSDESWEDMVPEEDVEDVPDYTEDIVIEEGEQEIGIKEGDVITWKENGSHWIVYLRRLEETAYFRADIRRCRYQLTLGNGSNYWVYVRGPVEQSMVWSQSNGNYFNKLNYTLIMYIQQNEETLKYFKRFKKVMINGQPWEVQATDSISTPGIIEVSLKETYNNTIEVDIEKAVEEATKKEIIAEQNTNEPYIYGSAEVYPYDVRHYEIKNYSGGHWSILNESRLNLVKLKNISDKEVDLHIITGKSGKFTLIYECNERKIIAALDIKIKSL